MHITKTKYDNVNLSAYHGHKICSTVYELTRLFGEPDTNNSKEDKTNYEWCLSLTSEDYDVIYFTIYDWKRDIKQGVNNGEIFFHIGGYSTLETYAALTALSNYIEINKNSVEI